MAKIVEEIWMEECGFQDVECDYRWHDVCQIQAHPNGVCPGDQADGEEE